MAGDPDLVQQLLANSWPYGAPWLWPALGAPPPMPFSPDLVYPLARLPVQFTMPTLDPPTADTASPFARCVHPWGLALAFAELAGDSPPRLGELRAAVQRRAGGVRMKWVHAEPDDE